VNLGLGTNVTNFNISLVENLNQTGAGVLCLKDAGRANLEEGLKAAGYSGFEDQRLNGLEASVQVIQLGHSGSALYNVSGMHVRGSRSDGANNVSARISCSTRRLNFLQTISVLMALVWVRSMLVTSRVLLRTRALLRRLRLARVLEVC
jgi:hypothetical protein